MQTVARAIKKLRGATQAELQGTLFGCASRIIKGTPVDTGRARGNWIPSIGSVPLGVSSLNDASGALMDTAEVTNRIKMGDTFFLTNNLPYIQRLEYGSSKQAPRGMVRRAIRQTIAELGKR